MYKYISISFLLINLIFSCTNQLKREDYLKYLNDANNGLLKTSTVNGLKIKVKHLPSDFLAYKEFVDSKLTKKEDLDSLEALYANSMTFLMELSPENETDEDIMLQDVQTEADYKERVNALNFEIKDQIELEVEGRKIYPSIANLENIYGLKNGRKIMVVFPINIKKEELKQNIVFTYSDDLYSTGINHFEFLSKDLLNIPSIKI